MDNWLSPALREPTQEALEIMRLSLVDWLACGLAGVDEPVAQLTRAMVLDEGGAEQSSLFGGGKAPARAAALVNGATSHALDYDDTHFAHIGHPSVAVNSAALAVAEREGADFDAFLRGCLAGCEASIRFGVLLGRDHYQIGFHQTATAGAFGATVAAGLLLGLSDDQMRHALGLVSTRASGLKSQFGTMGKPYNAGIAAANGVEAADLARRGFVSNPEALFGQNGFVTTHHGRGVEASTDDWLMEQISHKFHACCHGLHATLEALAMLDSGPVKDIQKVEITTHPRWMTVCNQHSPKTGLEAKFSYRAVTALALLGHDTASLDSYRDELMQDPGVLALMDKVEVTSEPSLAETEAWVVVTRQGVANASFDLNTPLSLQTRSDKIRAKAQVLTGDDRVWQTVHDRDLPDIVGLFR